MPKHIIAGIVGTARASAVQLSRLYDILRPRGLSFATLCRSLFACSGSILAGIWRLLVLAFELLLASPIGRAIVPLINLSYVRGDCPGYFLFLSSWGRKVAYLPVGIEVYKVEEAFMT